MSSSSSSAAPVESVFTASALAQQKLQEEQAVLAKNLERAECVVQSLDGIKVLAMVCIVMCK